MYHEDDWIQLSALQHYLFCPRQCALIHVDGLWAENRLTARGRVFHARVDSGEDEMRGDDHVVRSLNVYSREYGLSGRADVVEFKDANGNMVPYPVEYKSGMPKADECDAVQLCAQALCIEEMLGLPVPDAAIFYGKTRHRLKVVMDERLRTTTVAAIHAVHAMIEKRYFPDARYSKRCDNCSLVDLCMPRLSERKTANYIDRMYRCDEEAS
ncbi:MAG TPA: CRISPR-associated protein Cas4 [Candidatus Latescibacteria bacterium]|nr:CRISPR-associated protein Cas4 [Candidatus Latescibacterota bacterium]